MSKMEPQEILRIAERRYGGWSTNGRRESETEADALSRKKVTDTMGPDVLSTFRVVGDYRPENPYNGGQH